MQSLLRDVFSPVVTVLDAIFTRDSYAKRVLTIAEASVCLCVCLTVRHTLKLYQNRTS